MSAKIGITQTEMYARMIGEEFAPIISILQARSQEVESQVRDQVRKDFGIYKLHMEQEALKLKLAGLMKQLDKYEAKGYTSGKYMSLVDAEVEHRMLLLKDPASKIMEKKNELVKAVRLAGVHDDVRRVFDTLSTVMAEVKETLTKLPAPNKLQIPNKGRK